MKRSKLEQFIKRLNNDALFDLHEILIDEMNMRKANGSRTIKEVKELEQ
jgi:hypothetical protein